MERCSHYILMLHRKMKLTVCALYINIHASGGVAACVGIEWRGSTTRVFAVHLHDSQQNYLSSSPTHTHTLAHNGDYWDRWQGQPFRSHLLGASTPAPLKLRMHCHISVISINMLAAQKAAQRRLEKCLRICISVCCHRYSGALESLWKLASNVGRLGDCCWCG